MIRRMSSEKIFLGLVTFLWGYHAFFRYFGIVLKRIPSIGFIFLSLIVSFLIIGSIPYISKCVRSKDLLLGFLAIIVVLVTLLVNAKTTEPFNEIWPEFLLQCFVMYYVGLALHKKLHIDNGLLNILSIVSILSILILTIVFNNTNGGFEYEWSSNQYIPYSLLPHILLLMADIFKKMSIIKLLVVLYGFFNLVMLGNRGSIVCFLVMFLLLTIYKTISMNVKKRVLLLLGIGVFIFIATFTNLYDIALKGLYQYALDHNLSTRVFQTFLGEYTAGTSFDSGRLDIQKVLWQRLAQYPFGYGLGSDRYFVEQYAHSIILELLINFGIIIGGIILIIVLVKIVSGLRIVSEDSCVRSIYLISFCMGFVKLFISGSYLTEPYFYLLLGLSVSLIRTKKSNLQQRGKIIRLERDL